jgi:hypothetical protein
MMRQSLRAVAVAILSIGLAVPAFAETFTFDQLATSVPGFFVYATITVNGDSLSDLPTVDSTSNPIDFGNLTAFQISSNGFGNAAFNLGYFTGPMPPFNFPSWSISPDRIFFLDRFDENIFTISGLASGLSSIEVGNEATPPCNGPENGPGACVATGVWVPEPSTISLLIAFIMAGLLLNSLSQLKRGQ